MRAFVTRGFTLIELMIVVAIIGLLAALAIPNFVKFQCRAKQSEAKGNLKAVYVAEETYRAEADKYVAIATISNGNGTVATNSIGYAPRGTKRRYSYTVTSPTDQTFTATALADNAFAAELVNDRWIITEQTIISNNAPGCN